MLHFFNIVLGQYKFSSLLFHPEVGRKKLNDLTLFKNDHCLRFEQTITTSLSAKYIMALIDIMTQWHTKLSIDFPRTTIIVVIKCTRKDGIILIKCTQLKIYRDEKNAQWWIVHLVLS